MNDILSSCVTRDLKVVLIAVFEVRMNLANVGKKNKKKETIGGRVDRASVTEMVDVGSILGRVKPKTR